MKKRRINWPWGNPAFSAWMIDYPAGALVVRHNHAPVRSGRRLCEGWDLWLDSQYLGAIGSRSFGELIALSRGELSSLAQTACCARHQEFSFSASGETTGKHGGRRPNAGRKPKRAEAKRVQVLEQLPEFQPLLDSLMRNQGCHQPPLVTEDGRALEGNRRVAALRKLQAEHPKSKQWETITVQQLVKKISPEQEKALRAKFHLKACSRGTR